LCVAWTSAHTSLTMVVWIFLFQITFSENIIRLFNWCFYWSTPQIKPHNNPCIYFFEILSVHLEGSFDLSDSEYFLLWSITSQRKKLKALCNIPSFIWCGRRGNRISQFMKKQRAVSLQDYAVRSGNRKGTRHSGLHPHSHPSMEVVTVRGMPWEGQT
jgi:hypothetical protein